MKIKITYQDVAEEKSVLNLLNPILKGAKVRKTDTYKPYLHTYITTKDDTASSKIKEKP